MSNEAAERLRSFLNTRFVPGHPENHAADFEEALDTEYKAGADGERERIAKAVESASDGGSIYITRQRLQTILHHPHRWECVDCAQVVQL